VNLQIGIVADSLVWEEVFRQEGVPFTLADLSAGSIQDICSMLVVNRTLSNSERNVVEAYLRGGGAVLGYTQHLLNVAGTAGTKEKLDYLVGDHDDIFSSFQLLDLGLYGVVPREANVLRTQANQFGAFAGGFGGGHAVILPFDVEEVLSDIRVASKSFYSTRDRLPSERVSLVGKGEARQLLRRAFEYLHHVRNLPYAHLWYFPYGKRNLFAFRIDSDGALQRDIDELYNLATNHLISMTWFLDVKSHEPWLKHFARMVNQEIGVHCYEHTTFSTYDDNLKNMTRAVKEIEATGLTPEGFAAPFGMWNEELGKAIGQLGFQYSSEFSNAYDTLPLLPHTRGTRYHTLQVPVHPICPGSLMRVGYSSAHMKEYYWRVMNTKLSHAEPLFFYHHPSHRHLDVVEFIFQSMRQQNIDNVSLGEYARWWKKRRDVKFVVSYLNDRISMVQYSAPEGSQAGDGITLRVTTVEGKECLVSVGESVDLKTASWVGAKPPAAAPEDIRRIREFDPRTVLGELHTKFMRKFQ